MLRRMPYRMSPGGLTCVLGWLWGQGAGAQVLNEILYDPVGSDAGQEFVELFNTTPYPVSLYEFTIEFANGAQGPVWQTRWTGAASDSIAPHGHFLIVDRNWAGEISADAEVPLGLQNGPDAVRLVRADGSVDLLGYGQLEYPDMYEYEPAAAVAAGVALGRRPDGLDTDNNNADWRPLVRPTPRRANFRRWQLTAVGTVVEPPSWSVPGYPVVVTVAVANTGIATIPATDVVLLAAGDTSDSRYDGALATLSPGQRDTVTVSWLPHAVGDVHMSLLVPIPEPPAELEVPLGTYRVGVDTLYVNEVNAAPAGGACEWVEIANGGEITVDLGQYLLRDEDSVWRRLPSRLLAPRQFAVLVQDEARHRAWLSDRLDAGAEPPCADGLTRLVDEIQGSWPTLNNSAPTSRLFADRVLLARADSTVIDCVMLGVDGVAVPEGRSLERLNRTPFGAPAANWAVATAALGGTPGCPNSVRIRGDATIEVSLDPNPFYRDSTSGMPIAPLHIRFQVPRDLLGWDVRIFDLWGQRVRDLGGDRLGSGPRDLIWDGRDDEGFPVPIGGYIVLVRFYDQDQRFQAGGKKLAVLAEEAR